jgi:hypothetical protein
LTSALRKRFIGGLKSRRFFKMTRKVLVGAMIVFGFTIYLPFAFTGIAYAALMALSEF